MCADCFDVKDPWRLPPLTPDAISLKYPRPDTPLWPIANPEGVPDGIPLWDELGISWDDGLTEWVGP